jgi:hypothetical protein
VQPINEARIAIQQTIALYACAVDSRDIDTILSSFTDTATLQSSTGAVFTGKDQLAAFYRAALAAGARDGEAPTLLRHNITTSHIGVLTRQTAQATSYFITISPFGLDHAGQYRDHFARHGSDWLLERRQIEVEWFATPSWYQSMRLKRG